MKFKTVAQLIAELQQLPQDLPVLGGCHFDNDDGLTNDFTVRVETVAHSESRYFYNVDPGDPGSFLAVTL